MEAPAFSPLRRAGWSRPYAAPSLLCTSLAQTLPREVPVVICPPHPHLHRRKNRRGQSFASSVDEPPLRIGSSALLFDVRLSWPRRSLVRRIGIPRPRPRSRSVAAAVSAFPSLRPHLPQLTGSNTFAVTRLLQWLCHACAGVAAQGISQNAPRPPASPQHSGTPNDSYSRRVAASRRYARRE